MARRNSLLRTIRAIYERASKFMNNVRKGRGVLTPYRPGKIVRTVRTSFAPLKIIHSAAENDN